MEKSANSTREVLEKQDDLVTHTFDILEFKKEKEPRKRCKNDGMNEALRLRTKSHLMKLLDNLRFGGKKLEFDMELRRFVLPEITALDMRMQALSIDGNTPKQ